MVAKQRITSIREAVVRWYDKAQRTLPWRERSDDPYAVWVSEVMLQQTRVETVIPYYERFMKRFPSTQALARATEDQVLSHWSGLGYYRRARLLHKGVREVVARYGGEVPASATERLSLPGVGRYTAGAIGSVAFGKPEPIVDGNVARVVTRLDAVDTPLGSKETESHLWSVAATWAQGPDPSTANQALMELGALVCKPKAALCGECPAQRWCAAFRERRVGELPVPRPKKPPKLVSLVAVVATRSGEVLVSKSSSALFGGLHGVPMAEVPKGADPRAAALKVLRSHGKARLAKEPRGVVAHTLTHRQLSVVVYRATGASAEPPASLMDQDALDSVGVSTLTRKILAVAATPLR